MIKYERKRGKPAWTYTHAWPELPVECWQGARVMASCHKLSEVILAMRAGYPAAVTIEPTTSNKAQCITRDERFRPVEPFTIIPCPAQFRRPDGKRYSVCETCAICQNTDRLMRDRIAVGFQPDYGTSKKLLPLLK